MILSCVASVLKLNDISEEHWVSQLTSGFGLGAFRRKRNSEKNKHWALVSRLWSVLPVRSPRCRFSSGLTRIRQLSFLVGIWKKKQNKTTKQKQTQRLNSTLFYLPIQKWQARKDLRYPDVKRCEDISLCAQSDMFFLQSCPQSRRVRRGGEEEEGGGQMTNKPVNSKQHWPHLTAAPTNLYTLWRTMWLVLRLCSSLSWWLYIKWKSLL